MCCKHGCTSPIQNANTFAYVQAAPVLVEILPVAPIGEEMSTHSTNIWVFYVCSTNTLVLDC
jgi:hypothetical protein